MLSRVHLSRVAVELPTETFELPFADDLDLVLSVPDAAPPNSGPYGTRLHRLLSIHQQHVASLRREFKELAAAACASGAGPPVLTHGEPIASNILRYGDRLLIADWGEAMWGPPERDWSHVSRTIGGDPPCRSELRRLYDIRWILSEIAEYTRIFVDPHTGDADDAAMWVRLVGYLPEIC
jgi:spectinomycin phosphotransferase